MCFKAGAVYSSARANATEQSNGRYNSICIVPWVVLELTYLLTSDPTAAREGNDSEHDQVQHCPHQLNNQMAGTTRSV